MCTDVLVADEGVVVGSGVCKELLDSNKVGVVDTCVNVSLLVEC